MTVANNYAPIKQECNGATTSFSFDFPALTADEIMVYKNNGEEEVLVDKSEYSVEFNTNGGAVVFETAPEAGTILAITRLVDLSQQVPFKTSSGFPAALIEECFDKLTLIAQQQQQTLERCVKVEVTGNQEPQELIDEVFEQLETATVTGEAAIAAAEQAKEAATSAQVLSETAKQTIESETQVAIEKIDDHSNSVITTAESYAAQAKNYATSASTSEANAQKYAIRAENSLLPNQTGNAGKVLLTDGSAPYWGKSSNHQVVSVLPVEPEEDVFYYIPE